MDLLTATALGPTFRLVPSCFPPIAAFEDVSSADNLEAVIELEGWLTDVLGSITDRRIARLDELMPWRYAAVAA